MWKDDLIGFLRKSRASSKSVMIAAFMAALFLSLLGNLYFNIWTYEIETIMLEEGSWHGRITGNIQDQDLGVLKQFANVEYVEMKEPFSEGHPAVVELYFRNKRTIYHDMPLIAERLGLEDDSVCYHETLLSRYLIHDPQDADPPLLLTFYLAVLAIVSASLILIIHNSFVVSMNGRIHQLGILSSVGATPKQILACLMEEAAVLSVIPIVIGCLAGLNLSFCTIRLINGIGVKMEGWRPATFRCHPAVFGGGILVSVLTVWISAWLPAKKLSKLTPLQAIRNPGELGLKKKKHSPVLYWLFGIKGELVGNGLKAQKKAHRTSAWSLTLSFLGFTLMLCFFTLSQISTNHTYFERYQKAWDMMVTLNDTAIQNWEQEEELRQLEGVRSSVAYQKAEAVCPVPGVAISDELKALGGPEAVAGTAVTAGDGMYVVNAPVVIMGDRGFEEYCEQLGIAQKTDGCIVINRIWDSAGSNFRYPEYIPFLNGDMDTITLQRTGQEDKRAEVPVLAYTETLPVLREEYKDYGLVQVIPLSVWKQIGKQIGNVGEDTYIRVLGEDGVTLTELKELETRLLQTIRPEYRPEIENRIQEKADNDVMIKGFKVVLGAFCCLLALIGIANIYFNTLGFIRQRKREFAAYLSVGMTPKEMRQMFVIEALMVAGRPLLITFPITGAAVAFMIRASYLDPMEFLNKAPFVPICVFTAAVFGFVGLAYEMGWRRMQTCNLTDALRDDSMM